MNGASPTGLIGGLAVNGASPRGRGRAREFSKDETFSSAQSQILGLRKTIRDRLEAHAGHRARRPGGQWQSHPPFLVAWSFLCVRYCEGRHRTESWPARSKCNAPKALEKCIRSLWENRYFRPASVTLSCIFSHVELSFPGRAGCTLVNSIDQDVI